jgi:hypothetical protein
LVAPFRLTIPKGGVCRFEHNCFTPPVASSSGPHHARNLVEKAIRQEGGKPKR